MVGPSGNDLVWLLVLPLFLSILLAILMLFTRNTFHVLVKVAFFNCAWLAFGIGLLERGIGLLMLVVFPWVLCLSFVIGWTLALWADRPFRPAKTTGSYSNLTIWPDLEHEEMSLRIASMRANGFTVRRTAPDQWSVNKPGGKVSHYYSIEEFLEFARRHCEKNSA